MNLKTFEQPYGKFILKGDRNKSGSDKISTIVLHGAGKSSRATFLRLRQHLYRHGIPSVSFDFVGHGETDGDIKETTLHGRTSQAAAVIKYTCQEPLTLIAASMGGYSAIKLTEIFKVENLVLLVPAVYTPQVYDIPFGSEFTSKIRLQDSWKNSDAFDILSDFSGNVMIFAAEFDDVIPSELIEQLYASTVNAKNRALHRVPDSKHFSLFPKKKDFLVAMGIVLCGLTNGYGK